MKVSEIMTKNPQCCTPETTLKEAARLMAQCDCGELPVCDSSDSGHIVGVITDRDITCRAVAEGMDVNRTPVSACMTTPAITIDMESQLNDAVGLMEENMIRRIPITDKNGCVCGIVSQADIAFKGDGLMIAEVVREVSRPTENASSAGSASMR